MQWVDWIILAVLLGSMLAGMAQGLLRTACSLAGLIFGFLLASWNYRRLAATFKPIVSVEALANTIAFLLIVSVVMLTAIVAGAVLKRMFHWIGLGCIDIFGGAIVGFLQGALMVTLGILVTVAFFPQTAWLTHAEFPQLFFGACHLSSSMSPDELSGKVRDSLRTLEHEAPQWLYEKSGKL
jgi:membrane protein required for colicin V production